MAVELKNWIKNTVIPLKNKAEKEGIIKLSNTDFFRDPHIPNFINNNYFFSPADGIILYQKIMFKSKLY